MPKVILQVYPTLGPPEEMERRRPIGRDNEAYQDMLDGLVVLAKAADDLGTGASPTPSTTCTPRGWRSRPPRSCSTSTSARTRGGSCTASSASSCPSHDPIRLAEEIAMADHLLRAASSSGWRAATSRAG